MKKLVFFIGIVLMSMAIVGTISCSKSNKTNDSQEESSNEEMISEPDLSALYKGAITITTGELTKENKPGVGYYLMTLPLTIVNNTDIDFSSDDYVITYEYVTENTVNGELVDVSLNGSMNGPALPAKSKAETSIVQSGGFDLINVNFKLLISQEEFEKRYNEVQNK